VICAAILAPVSACAAGCRPRSSQGSSPPPEASAASAPVDARAIERAEDLRRARDVPAEAQRSHDVASRRLAARAYARILDSDDGPLLRALEDTDDEVVAWAGYGLGEACKGKEDAHVRAISARLASLVARAREDAGTPGRHVRGSAAAVMVRALGRCGGNAAEQTLRAWLAGADASQEEREQAAYALGEIAARRGSVSIETAGALLDAADGERPLDAALYAFGRAELAEEALRGRLVTSARSSLGREGPARVFALRALGRTKDPQTASDLADIVRSTTADTAERVEAARALGKLGDEGKIALVSAVSTNALDAPGGDGYAVLLASVDALGSFPADAPREAVAWLGRVAHTAPPADATPALARRISALRCGAAADLVHASWDSGVLAACDVGDGEAGERARLAALDRGPLTHARKAAWLKLAKEGHLREREAALEDAAHHPELGEALLLALADALASEKPGLVATAADVLHAHPERAFVLAGNERRAALDPRAPPPSSTPAREVDGRIAKALRAAIGRTWGPDLVETRVALVDAALALGLAEGRAYARAACEDANTTVRARASRALAAAGEKDVTCAAPATSADPAPELSHELTGPTRVVFDTDAGASLAIVFDPAFAPVAATRFVALARSGFYDGVAIHRVVPAFVVQFGDHGGDGYGGSGQTLRCETSPVPFGALDVGVALAGRDTGSSQLFVTLARHPHLDGEYAWVGRAEGDWSAVAEDDAIRSAHVEE
jgi:cyclophilin family peptidyl-prolyl cis-trans isomerase